MFVKDTILFGMCFQTVSKILFHFFFVFCFFLFRAIQRLDKEEVFGSSIKASFYNVKNKNNSVNNSFVRK